MPSPKKDESVNGCMRCGSGKLQSMASGSNVIPQAFGIAPVMGYEQCRRCGYYGIPLIFDSDEIRKEYENKKQKRQ